MPPFLHPDLFSFPFESNPLWFFTVKLAAYCFASSHSAAPSQPPFSSASAFSRYILLVLFHAHIPSLALSSYLTATPPPHPTTPETKLVYSVFSTSRLCAAVTVIFLSNICFFHLLIFFFFFLLLPTLLPPPPNTSSLPYNLKLCFSKLGSWAL